jgi:antitoxin VapB
LIEEVIKKGLKMETAKLLMNGDNQAVVLPKEFQFQGSEVYIKKIGSVIVLISKENPWQALFDSLSLFSEDFMESGTACTRN